MGNALNVLLKLQSLYSMGAIFGSCIPTRYHEVLEAGLVNELFAVEVSGISAN